MSAFFPAQRAPASQPPGAQQPPSRDPPPVRPGATSVAGGAGAAARAAIAAFVKARAGIVLGEDKGYMLDARLGPLLRRHGLLGLDDLAARLGGAPGGAAAEPLRREVVEALTTNESFFFRDGRPFDHLRRVLPALAAGRAPGAPLRVWSAACSTGQEAYSVAMVLDEIGPRLGGRRCEILGTDLSGEVVARAREGLYTQFEVQRGLPAALLVRHFRPEGDGRWRIAAALRAAARFEVANLLEERAAARGVFDVVFCRNVLIYFDPPTKARVLALVAERLAPDGVLYLGGAETVLGLDAGRFAPVPGERGAYTLAAGARGTGREAA